MPAVNFVRSARNPAGLGLTGGHSFELYQSSDIWRRELHPDHGIMHFVALTFSHGFDQPPSHEWFSSWGGVTGVEVGSDNLACSVSFNGEGSFATGERKLGVDFELVRSVQLRNYRVSLSLSLSARINAKCSGLLPLATVCGSRVPSTSTTPGNLTRTCSPIVKPAAPSA
jgi:hypothetical protein